MNNPSVYYKLDRGSNLIEHEKTFSDLKKGEAVLTNTFKPVTLGEDVRLSDTGYVFRDTFGEVWTTDSFGNYQLHTVRELKDLIISICEERFSEREPGPILNCHELRNCPQMRNLMYVLNYLLNQEPYEMKFDFEHSSGANEIGFRVRQLFPFAPYVPEFTEHIAFQIVGKRKKTPHGGKMALASVELMSNYKEEEILDKELIPFIYQEAKYAWAIALNKCWLQQTSSYLEAMVWMKKHGIDDVGELSKNFNAIANFMNNTSITDFTNTPLKVRKDNDPSSEKIAYIPCKIAPTALYLAYGDLLANEDVSRSIRDEMQTKMFDLSESLSETGLFAYQPTPAIFVTTPFGQSAFDEVYWSIRNDFPAGRPARADRTDIIFLLSRFLTPFSYYSESNFKEIQPEQFNDEVRNKPGRWVALDFSDKQTYVVRSGMFMRPSEIPDIPEAIVIIDLSHE